MPKRTDKRPPSPTEKYLPSPDTSTGFSAEIKDFLLDRKVRGQAKKTHDWHVTSIGKFVDYCFTLNVSRAAQVDARALRWFLAELEQRGHNTGGVSNVYRSVRVFLRWAATEYSLPHVLEALEKVPGPTLSDDPLDPIPLADVRQMLAACDRTTITGARDYALILVLLDTGIRHQEVTDLTVEDVDFADGSVLIKHGKGGKRRTVFIGAKTVRYLRVYLKMRAAPLFTRLRKRKRIDATNALWITRSGAPLTRAGIRQSIERRAKQAGVDVPGMHEFRRAFAVNSLRNGMDVITLQRLLGHSTLAIINRYLKLLSDDLRQAHSKYGVVDKM